MLIFSFSLIYFVCVCFTKGDGYIYVEPYSTCSSSDTCDGSEANPYPTIESGLEHVGDTNILVLLDGTYSGAGNINITLMSKYRRITSLNGPENAIIDCQGAGYGLGLFSGTFYISNITIENCVGIIRDNSNSYDINNNNHSLGGGIWIESTYTEIINCNFYNNTADYGGALFFFSNSLLIQNTNIVNNYANKIGGAIFIQSAYLNLNNTVNITYNKAGEGAGGVYMINMHLDSDLQSIIGSNKVDGDENGDQMVCVQGSANFYSNSGILSDLNNRDYDDPKDLLDEGDVVCDACSLQQIKYDFDFCNHTNEAGTGQKDIFWGTKIIFCAALTSVFACL